MTVILYKKEVVVYDGEHCEHIHFENGYAEHYLVNSEGMKHFQVYENNFKRTIDISSNVLCIINKQKE
jgi:lipopolysaccharide export system protein LptC